MIAIILAGVFTGKYLDIYFNSKPWLIFVFTMASVSLAMYSLVKDLFKK